MASPDILAQVVLQGVMLGAMYGLISLAMTLVYSTTHLFNFSHGAFMTVAMYVCVSLYAAVKLDPYISVFITTPLMFGLGFVLYRYLLYRVANVHVLMAAQITLGIIWVIESTLSTIYGPDIQGVPVFIAASKTYIGPLVISTPYIVSFVVAIVVGIVLWWLLQRTGFGRDVRALIQNRQGAQLMGVRVGRTQGVIFGIALALLGLVGPIIIPMVAVTPHIGLSFTIFAFMIMVFGGVGNLLGSAVAGVIFGVVQSLGMFFLSGYEAALVPYVMFVIVLLVRPRGIFGEK